MTDSTDGAAPRRAGVTRDNRSIEGSMASHPLAGVPRPPASDADASVAVGGPRADE